MKLDLNNNLIIKLTKRLKSVTKELSEIVWLLEKSIERKDKYG
tara:strand:+ start:415 stop:543 length:129 start_codon:yes stop_codon:yes gene_type:complete